MKSILKLLLIASLLALLVASLVDAQKESDVNEENADEQRVEPAGEADKEDNHIAEHNVGTEEEQEHLLDDGHEGETEADVVEDKEDAEHDEYEEVAEDHDHEHVEETEDPDHDHEEATEDYVHEHEEETEASVQDHTEDEHDDEDDIISELVHLDEPPSSEGAKAELEEGHTDEDHDDKHADHEADTDDLKKRERLNCCIVSLRKPLSNSSRCSCSQWLKHALRHSIFFRPLYNFVRASLSALPRMEDYDDDNEAKSHKDDEEGEDEIVKQSSLRDLGFFNNGYLGNGYYGGYPGYFGGYPGYYGYPGWGGGPGIGFSLFI